MRTITRNRCAARVCVRAPRRAVVELVAIGLACPVVVGAQAGTPLGQQSACVRAIPADSMQRVVVYLETDAGEDSTRPFLPDVDVLTQTVAARMRLLLGAGHGQLPQGEPTIEWWNSTASLRIIAHRDGRLIWSIESDTSKAAGLAVLARALRAVQDDGDAQFLWPDSTRDSLAFRLALRSPFLNPLGRFQTAMSLLNGSPGGFPVFSVTEPVMHQARVIRQPRLAYPLEILSDHVDGVVILQFVVDTTGRAEPSTVNDVWPADRPRLTGDLGKDYLAFVNAVRAALPSARFEPARIGGCPVRQLVQMPFNFKLGQ